MKLVYLFELDSVKKNDDQVVVGQRALFNEIIHNGNCVVLTLNQIVDSRTILSMMHDQKQIQILEYLFCHGFLKYSRYDDYRTPSQYLQRSIKENRSFIYSALPLRSDQKQLQNIVYRALKHDDLSEIEDLYQKQKMSSTVIKELCGNETFSITKQEAEQVLYYLKTLLMFILHISISNESYLPAIKYDEEIYPKVTFEDFMKLILGFCNDFEGFEGAKIILRDVQETLNDDSINSRSEWIKQIVKRKSNNVTAKEERILCLSECIVNLCYNYTLEYSIYGVSKHYEVKSLFYKEHASFQNDFFQRLIYEWDNGKDKNNRYLQEETNQFSWYVPEGKYLPDWKLAYRLLQSKYLSKEDEGTKINPFKKERGIFYNLFFKKYFVSKDDTKISLYENDYKKTRSFHKWRNREVLSKYLVVAIVSIIFIYVYFNVEDYVSTHAQGWIQHVLNNPWGESIFMFLFLGIFGGIMSSFFHVTDVLETFGKFLLSLKEIYLLFRMKGSSYVNDMYMNTLRYEPMQDLQDTGMLLSESLKRYHYLWEHEEICFTPSKQIPIVEPKKDNLHKLVNYEYEHHEKLGVVYESKYFVHVVDLIENRDSEGKLLYTTYERLLPAVKSGAVVVIVKYKDRFVLLKQFRHSIRKEQYAFIRGFGEENINTIDNVEKEVKEEIGASICTIPEKLGTVVADSGILGNEVSVYYTEIEELPQHTYHEGIEKVLLVSEDEMGKMIMDDEIDDGFTLSAYMLYVKTFEKRVVKG